MFTKQKAFCSVWWIGRGTLEARSNALGWWDAGTGDTPSNAAIRWSTDTLMNYLKYFCNIKLMFCSGDLDASLVHVQSGVDQGLDDLRHELLGHV